MKLPIVQCHARLPFDYVEHARILVRDGAVIADRDGSEIRAIQSGVTSVLLLGPGVSITHDAIGKINECNCIIQWISGTGLSMYSATLSSTSNMRNAARQLKMVSTMRMELWNRMLELRTEIPEFHRSSKWRELMLIEATAMKQLYADTAYQYGIAWTQRVRRLAEMSPGDKVNRIMTLCNCALYSVATSVILAKGYIPSIAVIHASGPTPMAYDLADMVKAHTSIPFAMAHGAGFADDREMYDAFRTLLIKQGTVDEMATFLDRIFA